MHVVRYLTRYLTGGPISDWRITHADDKTVTILARQRNRVGGDSKQVPCTMKTEDFVRRWCQHIQPPQLTKTRQFGGWANTGKAEYRSLCLASLESAGLSTAKLRLEASRDPEDCPAESSSDHDERSDDIVCEHCGSDRVRLAKEIVKPSWKEIFRSQTPSSIAWYLESLDLAERAEWDALMGEGYSDFYDENIKPALERARGIRGNPSPPASTRPLESHERPLPLLGDVPSDLAESICNYELVSF